MQLLIRWAWATMKSAQIGSGVLYTELKIPTEFLLSILKKTEFLLSGCAFSFLNDDANIANNKNSELLYIIWLFQFVFSVEFALSKFVMCLGQICIQVECFCFMGFINFRNNNGSDSAPPWQKGCGMEKVQFTFSTIATV